MQTSSALQTRYEFDLRGSSPGLIIATGIQAKVAPLQKARGLLWRIDSELLFFASHFNGDSWAIYSKGQPKGGTIRYAEGYGRIPKFATLPVFVTEEYNAGNDYPKAIVTFSKVVVADGQDFTPEELMKDDFNDVDGMIAGMKGYYGSIEKDKTSSFYEFGETIFRPSLNRVIQLYEAQGRIPPTSKPPQR